MESGSAPINTKYQRSLRGFAREVEKLVKAEEAAKFEEAEAARLTKKTRWQDKQLRLTLIGIETKKTEAAKRVEEAEQQQQMPKNLQAPKSGVLSPIIAPLARKQSPLLGAVPPRAPEILLIRPQTPKSPVTLNRATTIRNREEFEAIVAREASAGAPLPPPALEPFPGDNEAPIEDQGSNPDSSAFPRWRQSFYGEEEFKELKAAQEDGTAPTAPTAATATKHQRSLDALLNARTDVGTACDSQPKQALTVPAGSAPTQSM